MSVGQAVFMMPAFSAIERPERGAIFPDIKASFVVVVPRLTDMLAKDCYSINCCYVYIILCKNLTRLGYSDMYLAD